jgi:hypothetical protein
MKQVMITPGMRQMMEAWLAADRQQLDALATETASLEHQLAQGYFFETVSTVDLTAN